MTKNPLKKIKNNSIKYKIANEGLDKRTYITPNYVVQEPKNRSKRELRKNAFLCDYLHKKGAATPKVIEQVEKPFHIIFEKIEGTSLSEKDQFEKEEYLKAVENTGQELAKIHSIEGIGYGEPDSEKQFKTGSHENWRKFVNEYTQDTLDYVSKKPFKGISRKAFKLIKTGTFPSNPRKSILHMDYGPKNVIIGNKSTASVIDLDDSYYGDPRFDVMYTAVKYSRRDKDAAEALHKGYTKERDLQLSKEVRMNYIGLAILQDAKAAEWCLRHDKDIETEKWAESLKKILRRPNSLIF